MAEIDGTYKRRINIAGKADDVEGWMLKIYDAETGKEITNIHGVFVTLKANRVNEATILYYDQNWRPGDPPQETRADIDKVMLTALEV